MSRSLLIALVGALSLASGIWPVVPVAAAVVATGTAQARADAVSRYSPAGGAASEPVPGPVKFELLKDEVDDQGHWTETFRMTIGPGGSLADASELVCGNLDYVDELFKALKKQYPDLQSPGQVPANISAEVTVDPTAAFVPEEVTTDPDRGATVYAYYNGAQRITYDPKRAGDHKGLSDIVDLPGDRPTKTFQVLQDNVRQQLPAGVRVAYYTYQPTDSLKRVVAEIYGTDSTRAVGDFLSQTQWDPMRWPPRPIDYSQRLIIPLGKSYADEPFTPLDVTAGNPADAAQVKKQVDERARAGIYTLRREPYGTVYRVVANDFTLTARLVSKLLYGNEDQYLAIAAKAGFGTLHDLTQNPQQDFRLFGRSFDVLVDYEQEQFQASQAYDQAAGKRTTVLLNGTVVEQWDVAPGKSGVLREARLPSGYRKILYRPNTVGFVASQVLYGLVSLGRSSASPEVAQQEEGSFVTSILWDWGRSVPHEPGDVLDYGQIVEQPTADGRTEDLLQVAIRPSQDAGLRASPYLQALLSNPFALGLVATIAALLALGMFSWVARRV